MSAAIAAAAFASATGCWLCNNPHPVRHTSQRRPPAHPGRYGPTWFIRLPWKAAQLVAPRLHFFAHNGPEADGIWPWGRYHFLTSVDIMRSIDTSNDGVVTPAEIDAHVRRDGIDWEQYRLRITAQDRCRAAAFMTWVIAYARDPYPITSGCVQNDADAVTMNNGTCLPAQAHSCGNSTHGSRPISTQSLAATIARCRCPIARAGDGSFDGSFFPFGGVLHRTLAFAQCKPDGSARASS